MTVALDDGTDPILPMAAEGEFAQMQQIRQSLVHVATVAADKAAQATIERLFVGLGVDISKPEGIIDLQKTIAFAGALRNASATVSSTSLKTAIGLMIAGGAGWLVLGFKDWIHHP